VSFMFRGADWHAAQASTHGRRAKAILFDYIFDDGDDVPYILDEIIAQTVKAAHHAKIAIESREMSQAAVRKKLANLDEQRVRQMMTPRCTYRRVTYEKRPDGMLQPVAGDPCGGKLKVVRRRREFIGGECVTCGRFYPIPKEPEAASAESVPAEATT